MELFYSDNISGSLVTLDREESMHCVRVLRHREGDRINVIDGKGTLLTCRITDASPKAAQAVVESAVRGFGSHPYRLEMAVCPTKNMARYEWFAEKATEAGLDSLVPVIGEHSERRTLNAERLRKIMLSAAKQSLKACVPVSGEAVSVSDYLKSAPESALRLIAYCDESLELSQRRSLEDRLMEYSGSCRYGVTCPGGVPADGTKETDITPGSSSKPEICVLIGPEGDFSEKEISLAMRLGWKPVSLGQSRLRTETAALAAVFAVYFVCGR